MKRLLQAAVVLLIPVAAAAQSLEAPPTFSTAEEIALAKSAAPEAVSADATIWVLSDGEFEIAVNGTNTNHCFVQRSVPLSLEPICYDAEGAATILQWEFEYFALRTAGLSSEELELELAEAVGTGKLSIPKRPALAYMMSSAQRLYDPESGRNAGNWMPHLMLYVPYLTTEEIGLSTALPTIQVARAGTPLAHLIVVVPEFVDPKVP